MTEAAMKLDQEFAEHAVALAALDSAKHRWTRTSVDERIAVLQEVKDALMAVAEDWVMAAASAKQLSAASPLVGEEWLSGPYALMSACNSLMATLSEMERKAFLDRLPVRELPTGQVAVQVAPHSIWDRLLLSGVKAEVWMLPEVTRENLADHVATAYDVPVNERRGKVALVLGAGNIASIAPLDAFQKLFLENQVVILKMNPVNEYLTDYLNAALRPLIERDALRIVKGGGREGAWLTEHPIVEEIHITGAQSTHDAIIWGTGPDGDARRKSGMPRLDKRITSELGAVCPTIVVPGPWTDADIQFQAEHLATQKLHNSGFNCVACQALIMPSGWSKGEPLLAALQKVLSSSTRLAYYPGAESRLAEFEKHVADVIRVPRGPAPALLIGDLKNDWFRSNEVFAPALSVHQIEAADPERFLRDAIAFANEHLHGTLGANILIHPRTMSAIGRARFEEIVAELRYGTIAINAWTGLGFLMTTCPWGAFPGHTLDDVQSGVGTVHNTFMLEKTERTVIEAPFRPFPRSLMSGQLSLLPRPPWFITNSRQHVLGRLLTRFQYRPNWRSLPRLFLNALRG